MIFHHLRDLPPAYDHVYLSPHLDDAALSCGGLIAAQRAAGESVLVVTLCTAAPPAAGPFSDLALAFHQAWGLSPAEVVAARLQEDAAAMGLLAADALWAGCLDAIYRHPGAYSSRAALFGAPAADDPLRGQLRALIGALRQGLPAASFYGPLGVGTHVDHQLTHSVARELLGEDLALYEDFPYVARPGELERRLAQVGAGLAPRARPIAATLPRKLAAIGAYGSQLPELAQSQLGRAVAGAEEAAAVMAAAVAAYAALAGGGTAAERIWRAAS